MPLIPEDRCCILPSHQHSSTISTIDLSPHLAQQHTKTGRLDGYHWYHFFFGHVTLVLTTPLPVAKHGWPPTIASCSNHEWFLTTHLTYGVFTLFFKKKTTIVPSARYSKSGANNPTSQYLCKLTLQTIWIMKPKGLTQALLTLQVVRQASEPPVGLCNTFLLLAIRWRVHAAVSKQLNPSSHHGVGKRPYHDGNYSGR